MTEEQRRQAEVSTAIIAAAHKNGVPLRQRDRSVEYLDAAPRILTPTIEFVEYVERVKRLKLDPWQKDFCARLQTAAVDRPVKATRAIVHVQAQAGKSSLLSQAFVAWLLGHDPLYRIALATYNVTQSQRHSRVVIGLMNLPIHKEIFPNKDGWISEKTSRERWSTPARDQLRDGQPSFNPVGLQTGLTGSGADCLVAGTMVETEHGPLDIQELYHGNAVGTRVWSIAPHAEVATLQPIVAVRETEVYKLVILTTEGERRLVCTPDHRIAKGHDKYLAAEQMTNSRVVTWEDHDIACDKVIAVVRLTTEQGVKVYDIQVEGNCNFFANGVLVHNCLLIDDPYASQQEAFSSTIRESLINFWEYTVVSRLSQTTNVFGMFHRYSPMDIAGYLLDKGDFDYWRYAAIADGDYIHETTGQRFPDPMGREVGEYLSPRFGESYYREAQENSRVWLAMFQGRPTAEEGEFFLVNKIDRSPDVTARLAECSVFVRAWDLAATEKGGDYSTAPILGMSPDGRATVFDCVHEQVESAGRDVLQVQTAQADGKDVVITVPDDPGAAGKTALFHIQQLLREYQVVPRSTSGSKETRARPLASAVNSGMISFAPGAWQTFAMQEMREFPLSEHDDFVDSLSDAYSEAYQRLAKGLVIKGLGPRNFITLNDFREAFPILSDDGISVNVPGEFFAYAGIKVTPEENTPNAGILVVQGDYRCPETLFMLAEYKQYGTNAEALFQWLEIAVATFCPDSPLTVWLHPDSAEYRNVIWQKLEKPVSIFREKPNAGFSELNWYLSTSNQPHLTSEGLAPRLYAIAEDEQLGQAVNAEGFVSLRQEAATWGFLQNGEPSKVGAVADCLRMITWAFHTTAATIDPLLKIEREIMDRMPEALIEPKNEMDAQAKYLWLQRERNEVEYGRAPVRRAGSGLGRGTGRSIDAWRGAKNR